MRPVDVPAAAVAVHQELGDQNDQARTSREHLSRTPPTAEPEPAPGWRTRHRVVDGAPILPDPWLDLDVEDFLAVGPAWGVLFRWQQGAAGEDGTTTFTVDPSWYLYLHDVSGSNPGAPSTWDEITEALDRHLDAGGTWRHRYAAGGGAVRAVRFDLA